MHGRRMSRAGRPSARRADTADIPSSFAGNQVAPPGGPANKPKPPTATKPTKLTRAQKLAKALKTCRKLKRKKRRQACERKARKA